MAEKAPAAPRRRARTVRWIVLAAVLVFVTALGIAHQRLGVGKPVGVDALCPFGGLETLGTLVTGGFLVRRIALSSVLLLGATVGTAVVFRRAFCGRICPLGFLQELAGTVGRKVIGRRLTLPRALDRPARLLKYVVLAAILWLTWSAAELVIRPYDPWVAYNHLTSADLFAEFGVGVAVLAIALAGSVVYDRFFCKYACPMGAFLGLISRFSLFKVRRDAETCIDCKLCDRACPVGVAVSTAQTVTDPECIDCGECVTACPVEGALATGARTAGTTRRLGPVAVALGSVALFAALVLAATASGSFAWTMPTLAEETGSGTDGASFDTALIKGSTTMAEVSDAAGIPPEVFTRVYGVPASEQTGQLKVLKDTYGCSPGEVRAFVEAYRTDPAVVDSWVPGTAHAEEEH
jgi:ferredoxin